METMIANRRGNFFSFTESKKDKNKFKINVKVSHNLAKEAMFIFIGGSIQIMEELKLEDKKYTPFKDVTKRHPTLKTVPGKKNINFLTQTCQECLMIFLKKRSLYFQSHSDPKKLEESHTQNIVDIRG